MSDAEQILTSADVVPIKECVVVTDETYCVMGYIDANDKVRAITPDMSLN